jgi:hypothetical protein
VQRQRFDEGSSQHSEVPRQHGVPVAGVQEDDGKVARKLLRLDVVLVESSVRAKRRRSVGTTVRPSGGGG